MRKNRFSGILEGKYGANLDILYAIFLYNLIVFKEKQVVVIFV